MKSANSLRGRGAGRESPPTIVMGIDEAGRGPGLGPMVLAGVVLDDVSATMLSQAGVQDSKAFGATDAARRTRADLASLIREHAVWVSVEICEVDDIDAYVGRGALNQLERERARLLVQRGPICSRIIADGRTLFSALTAEFPHLEAHDRAESLHTAVAAASICAKAERDKRFHAIARRYFDEFGTLRGGGYVNPPTCAFVAEFVRRHGHLPPEARKSWPWQNLAASENADSATTALPGPRVR
jgi:ribonuclease HII